MSQRVEIGATFETDSRVAVNVVGQPIYVCDCCYIRRHYVTKAACDAHEDYSAAHTSDAMCGIYPDL